MNSTILLVDDDIHTLDTTKLALKYKYNVLTASTVSEAETVINTQAIDVVVTDLNFKGQPEDGLDLINWAIKHKPDLPVIVVTGDREDVVRLVKSQRRILDDFILKPYQMAELVLAIEKARERVRKNNEQKGKIIPRDVITQDERIKTALHKVKQVTLGDNHLGICIYGESGVGKEEIAKYAASLLGGPCVSINMSAIPLEVAEKELFGAKKGSFTGATEDSVGKFQAANGGVLFLDEIGDCHPDIQAKLLRAIQERQVVRLGSNTPENVNVRIIAATNRNLKKMISDGTFREDLYYRIEGIAIAIPPLRERKQDIPLLIGKFLNDMQPKTKTVSISSAALQVLLDYNWPGNVRELRSVIQSALVDSGSRDIEVENISEKIRSPSGPATPEMTVEVANVDLDLERTLRHTEKNLIIRALRTTKGSRKEAMRLLNMSSAKFFRRIKDLGIDLDFLNESRSDNAT